MISFSFPDVKKYNQYSRDLYIKSREAEFMKIIDLPVDVIDYVMSIETLLETSKEVIEDPRLNEEQLEELTRKRVQAELIRIEILNR